MLDLTRTGVTGAGVRELRKALPLCQINFTAEVLDAKTIDAFQKLGAEYGSIGLHKVGLVFEKNRKPSSNSDIPRFGWRRSFRSNYRLLLFRLAYKLSADLPLTLRLSTWLAKKTSSGFI